MKQKTSRFEANKEVRHVLARHHADMGELQFQTYGREIRLTGTLVRTDGGDFTVPQVQAMLEDFSRVLPRYNVVGDMDNWNFTQEGVRQTEEQDDDRHNSYFEEEASEGSEEET